MTGPHFFVKLAFYFMKKSNCPDVKKNYIYGTGFVRYNGDSQIPEGTLRRKTTKFIESRRPTNMTDIEIAQQSTMLPIEEVAAKIGIGSENLEHYGCLLYTSPSPRD